MQPSRAQGFKIQLCPLSQAPEDSDRVDPFSVAQDTGGSLQAPTCAGPPFLLHLCGSRVVLSANPFAELLSPPVEHVLLTSEQAQIPRGKVPGVLHAPHPPAAYKGPSGSSASGAGASASPRMSGPRDLKGSLSGPQFSHLSNGPPNPR